MNAADEAPLSVEAAFAETLRACDLVPADPDMDIGQSCAYSYGFKAGFRGNKCYPGKGYNKFRQEQYRQGYAKGVAVRATWDRMWSAKQEADRG